jgi:hypothetical protein
VARETNGDARLVSFSAHGDIISPSMEGCKGESHKRLTAWVETQRLAAG